jgi:outer membrane cobalamin receptor
MRFSPAVLGLVSTVWISTALTACSTSTVRGEGGSGPGRVITAEQIQRSGVRTAWDAVTRLLPNLSFSEDRTGKPKRLGRRGTSSMHLNDVPQVVVDGVRISDYRTLESVPAQNIASIQLLSGLDGTTYYGTNAGDGVIVIRTHSGGE